MKKNKSNNGVENKILKCKSHKELIRISNWLSEIGVGFIIRFEKLEIEAQKYFNFKQE